MKTEFSFYYGEKRHAFSVQNGAVYELEPGVTVRVAAKEYSAFGATEWLLYFENKSDQDSQIFSDICDCDTVLPLEFVEAPRSGYKPAQGNACVIAMNGKRPEGNPLFLKAGGKSPHNLHPCNGLYRGGG